MSNSVPVVPEKHAEFSPSQLPRIIACPGSYKASKDQPNPSSPFAEEGTRLHEVMKHFLTAGVYEVGEDASPFTLDDEQCGCVNQLLSWVQDTKALYSGLEVIEMIEQQVSLSWLADAIGYRWLLDEVAGTADYILIVPSERILIVADWKFGRGVEVFATSDQLKAYALGALKVLTGSDDTRYWRVRAVIGQPRIKSDVEEHIYFTKWRQGELFEWFEHTLIPALINATSTPVTHNPDEYGSSDHPTFNPDEDGACKFCRAIGCRARYEARMEDFNALIGAEEAQAEITIEEKVSLVEKFWRLEKYMSVIQGELYVALMSGLPVPGMKLVKGRASRSWALGENAIINTLMGQLGLQLKDCYVEPKLCSPAQIEKKLPKGVKKSDDFISLVKTSSGKPSMVPESDKRPALEGAAAQYSADDVDFNCGDDDFS